MLAWSGNSETPDPATSVLNPVAIYVEGRFYDATLYEAQPAPLAVDPGVVYDVLRSGEPIGTFTLGYPRQQGDLWYGLGRYLSKEQAEAEAKPKQPLAPKKPAVEEADDRPHLRRGPPPPTPPKEQSDQTVKSLDTDPERPTLHRHTAADDKKREESDQTKAFIVPPTHLLAAISAVGGPEMRSFAFHDQPGELDQLRGKMETLAKEQLAPAKPSASATTPASRPRRGAAHASTTPTAQSAPQLQNGKLGIYDVNSDNAPILVYSATAMVGGAKKYVTVAAWEEIDQSTRKVFGRLTDDRHLDVYPRLEIVDCVDARGTGRGELLFRAYGDQGSRFILYHPGPDSLDVLFDAAKAEQ